VTSYLLVFILALIIDVVALVLDAILRSTGHTTITTLAQEWLVVAILIVSFQFALPVFLALHVATYSPTSRIAQQEARTR